MPTWHEHLCKANQASRSTRSLHYQRNLSIIDIILALGQRGIPSRGNWDKKKKSGDGNFAFFLNWKSTFHEDLKEHLEHAPANAKYTSPREYKMKSSGFVKNVFMRKSSPAF